MLRRSSQVKDKLSTHFGSRLSNGEGVLQLALLGLLSGIGTGGVILLFRSAIEWPLEHFLPGADSEAF